MNGEPCDGIRDCLLGANPHMNHCPCSDGWLAQCEITAASPTEMCIAPEQSAVNPSFKFLPLAGLPQYIPGTTAVFRSGARHPGRAPRPGPQWNGWPASVSLFFRIFSNFLTTAGRPRQRGSARVGPRGCEPRRAYRPRNHPG